MAEQGVSRWFLPGDPGGRVGACRNRPSDEAAKWLPLVASCHDEARWIRRKAMKLRQLPSGRVAGAQDRHGVAGCHSGCQARMEKGR